MSTTATVPAPMPKSYLTEEDREEMRRNGFSQDGIYASESSAADQAGDSETSWQWLALSRLPAHTLLLYKRILGADFIRERGFMTKTADEAYGEGWLDDPSF